MKIQTKLLLKSILLCGIVTFFGCSGFAAELKTVPYQISGEMVLGPSKNFLNAGFDFEFYNKSEKKINDFTIVFYLFDEDGNPPSTGKNNFVFKISSSIEPGEELSSSVSLDKYLSYVPDEPYEVDYLYVSSITYSDGTQWSDPFGFLKF